MDFERWCWKKKDGIKIVEPNKNISESYIEMAEESTIVLPNVRFSRIWTAAVSYYIFYYSLYAVMLRIGVKCEIHSCSIEFMEKHLMDFFNNNDQEMIKKAFGMRIDTQYYADRELADKDISLVSEFCMNFFIKAKDILSNISQDKITIIRNDIKSFLFHY